MTDYVVTEYQNSKRQPNMIPKNLPIINFINILKIPTVVSRTFLRDKAVKVFLVKFARLFMGWE